MIKENKVRNEDILRLLCLYALRYERHAGNELNTFKLEVQRHRRFPEKYTQVRSIKEIIIIIIIG